MLEPSIPFAVHDFQDVITVAGFQISKLWETTGLHEVYGEKPPATMVFSLFQSDVHQALLRAATSRKQAPSSSAPARSSSE